MMTDHQIEAARVVGNAGAITVAGATLIQLLPPIAALFSILWTAIMIYETKTVQTMIARWRKK